MYQQHETTAAPIVPFTESFFTDISMRLEAEVKKREWTNRPRHWFILNQIKRLDAMEAFIKQGLNEYLSTIQRSNVTTGNSQLL